MKGIGNGVTGEKGGGGQLDENLVVEWVVRLVASSPAVESLPNRERALHEMGSGSVEKEQGECQELVTLSQPS